MLEKAIENTGAVKCGKSEAAIGKTLVAGKIDVTNADISLRMPAFAMPPESVIYVQLTEVA